MGTLLAKNDKVALIGEMDGSVHTEALPLADYHSQPAHANKNDEYYVAPRASNVASTDIPSIHFLHTNEEKFPFQTYHDEVNELSVRAAFDPQTELWIVADLDSDINPTNASLPDGAI